MHKIGLCLFLFMNSIYSQQNISDLNHEVYIKALLAGNIKYEFLGDQLSAEIDDFEVPLMLIFGLEESKLLNNELVLGNYHERCHFKPRSLDHDKQVLVGRLNCTSKLNDFDISKFKK